MTNQPMHNASLTLPKGGGVGRCPQGSFGRRVEKQLAKGADRVAVHSRPGRLARGVILAGVCAVLLAPSPFLAAQEGQQQATSTPTAPLSMPSAQEVDKAVTDATRYTLRHCARDGSFLYQVDAISGKRSREYDILRHAGTMVSLGMVQRFYRAGGPAYVSSHRASSGCPVLAVLWLGRGL